MLRAKTADVSLGAAGAAVEGLLGEAMGMQREQIMSHYFVAAACVGKFSQARRSKARRFVNNCHYEKSKCAVSHFVFVLGIY
jgi:hypothetical protein